MTWLVDMKSSSVVFILKSVLYQNLRAWYNKVNVRLHSLRAVIHLFFAHRHSLSKQKHIFSFLKPLNIPQYQMLFGRHQSFSVVRRQSSLIGGVMPSFLLRAVTHFRHSFRSKAPAFSYKVRAVTHPGYASSLICEKKNVLWIYFSAPSLISRKVCAPSLILTESARRHSRESNVNWAVGRCAVNHFRDVRCAVNHCLMSGAPSLIPMKGAPRRHSFPRCPLRGHSFSLCPLRR